MPIDLNPHQQFKPSTLSRTLRANFRLKVDLELKAADPMAPKLLEKVLNWRVSGNPENLTLKSVLNAIQQAGMDDPFEKREDIKNYVDQLIEVHQPKTVMDTAVLFFSAVSLPGIVFKANGIDHLGLPDSLVTKYTNVSSSALPKEMLDRAPAERIACCLDATHLLMALFRSAGFEIHPKVITSHVYAIAMIDGKKYKLDPANKIFEITGESPSSDRESLAAHYDNKGFSQLRQNKLEEAELSFGLAKEIDPLNYSAWLDYGVVLARLDKDEEAIDIFTQCTKMKPDHDPWHRIAVIRFNQARHTEAIAANDRALRLNPDYVRAMILKARSLIALEQYPAAGKLLGKVQPGKYLFATSRHLLGTIRVKLNDFEVAKIYFKQAEDAGYELEKGDLNRDDLNLPQYA